MLVVIYDVDAAGVPQCSGSDMALADTLGPLANKKYNHETGGLRTSDKDMGVHVRGKTVYDWKDLGKLAPTEDLYIIAHGTEGVRVGEMTAHHMAIALDLVLPPK